MDQVPDRRRNAAAQRVHERADFYRQVIIWIIIHVQLTGIWLLTGQGQFWPVWSMLVWGTALALEALKVGLFHFLAERLL